MNDNTITLVMNTTRAKYLLRVLERITGEDSAEAGAIRATEEQIQTELLKG